MMFLVFVAISATLWFVLALNEEEQYDVRLPVAITHVPDSVTLIQAAPEALNVSLRARGTQLLKMYFGNLPTVSIDFRGFRTGGSLHLSSAELKSLARTAVGGSQVNVVYPDTLTIPYTTHPGFKLPIHLDYKVTTGPQSAMVGYPKLSVDSATVYLLKGQLPSNYTRINTEPVQLVGIDKNVTRRVKLIGPKGSRVIPDSIDVTFEVEPLIFKSRKVVIEPVNVPKDIKLITFPAQIEVFYLVPMSLYASSDPHFRVVADYHELNKGNGSKMMKLQLKEVPSNLQNVHIKTDSAEYIIEHL